MAYLVAMREKPESAEVAWCPTSDERTERKIGSKVDVMVMDWRP